MIKKYLSAFGILFLLTVLLVMTLTALAQVQQVGPHRRDQSGMRTDHQNESLIPEKGRSQVGVR